MFTAGFEKIAIFNPKKHLDGLMLRVAEKLALKGRPHAEALDIAMSMSKPELYKELGMGSLRGTRKVLANGWTGTRGAIRKLGGVGFDVHGYTSDAKAVADHRKKMQGLEDDAWLDEMDAFEVKHGRTGRTPGGSYKYNDWLATQHRPFADAVNRLTHDTAYSSPGKILILDKKKDRAKIKEFMKHYSDAMRVAIEPRPKPIQPTALKKLLGAKPQYLTSSGKLSPEPENASASDSGEAFKKHVEALLKDKKIKSLAFEYE